MLTPPRKGQRGTYYSPVEKREIGFTVLRVEGPYCYVLYDEVSDKLPAPSMFIWRFKDGPNLFHHWPGKEEAA